MAGRDGDMAALEEDTALRDVAVALVERWGASLAERDDTLAAALVRRQARIHALDEGDLGDEVALVLDERGLTGED